MPVSLTTSTVDLTVSMRWPRTSRTSHTTPSARCGRSPAYRCPCERGLNFGLRESSMRDEPSGRICTSQSGSYSSPRSIVRASLLSASSLRLPSLAKAWRDATRGMELPSSAAATASPPRADGLGVPRQSAA